MPEANSIDIEIIAKALDNVRLMVENLEDIVKHRLAHPTEATGGYESTKVGESLSLEGMDHVQLQEQILALSTDATDNHETTKALEYLSLEGTDFVHVQQSGLADSTKATTAHKIPKSLDFGRLKDMNLAYWQEKRLGQHLTEVNLDLETAKRLKCLSLKSMDLAYLQQQRLVHCPKPLSKLTTAKGILSKQRPGSPVEPVVEVTAPFPHILLEGTMTIQRIIRARTLRNVQQTSIFVIPSLLRALVFHFHLANKNNGSTGIAARWGLAVMKSTISQHTIMLEVIVKR
jgi:hypothetical protein